MYCLFSKRLFVKQIAEDVRKNNYDLKYSIIITDANNNKSCKYNDLLTLEQDKILDIFEILSNDKIYIKFIYDTYHCEIVKNNSSFVVNIKIKPRRFYNKIVVESVNIIIYTYISKEESSFLSNYFELN